MLRKYAFIVALAIFGATAMKAYFRSIFFILCRLKLSEEQAQRHRCHTMGVKHGKTVGSSAYAVKWDRARYRPRNLQCG